MTSARRIAIDAMGGDVGPRVTVAGTALAKAQWPDLDFVLVGDTAAVTAEVRRARILSNTEVLHAPDVIGGETKPSQAMRRSKTTSMGIAINLVKQGQAAAAVSAGNTGALMAMAKLALRTLPGISRPALAALMPSRGATDTIMLDLGANAECDTRNLVEFAVMGAAYARCALGLARPRVHLLNIGTEETKGTDEIRDAAALLRQASDLAMVFEGFIEGDRITSGLTDVVVTDGFTGNIALKTAEGTARFVADLLREAFTSSLRSKIGFLVSRPATKLLQHRLDPNNHNGAVFLGLNGIVVKSHGGANAKGIANAIGVTAKLVANDITRRISDDLDHFAAHRAMMGAMTGATL